MALDPSVLLQAQGIRTPDPLESVGKLMSLAQITNQNAMSQYALAKAKRDEQQATDMQSALPVLLRGGWSDAAVQQAMTQYPGAAAAIQAQALANRKARAEAEKEAAQTDKYKAEATKENLASLANMAAAASDAVTNKQLDPQRALGQVTFAAQKLGLEPSMLGVGSLSYNDPVGAAATLQRVAGSAMTLAQRIEQQGQAATRAETGRHNLATESNQLAATTETGRHNKATEAHSWADLAFRKENEGKPTIVQDPNGGGIYSVNAKTAQGQPVRGPDGNPLVKAEKPLTETQGSATAYGMRMKASNDILSGMEASGFDLGQLSNKLADYKVTNLAASPEAQKAYAAKLNFMTASLRKESGAVISPTEFQTEDKKYFPQFGDSPEVREQKRQARELAIRAMTIQAGPGAKNMANTGPAQPAAPAPAAGPQTFNSMPDPAKYSGRRVRDDNGTVYRSDGTRWVRE